MSVHGALDRVGRDDDEDSYSNSFYANRQRYMPPSQPKVEGRRRSSTRKSKKKKATLEVAWNRASSRRGSKRASLQGKVGAGLRAIFGRRDRNLEDHSSSHYGEDEETSKPRHLRDFFLMKRGGDDAVLSYMLESSMNFEE